MSIPAVSGIGNIDKFFKNDQNVIVNGTTGCITVNPSDTELKNYQQEKARIEEFNKYLSEYLGKDTITLDKKRIELCGNIGNPKDLDRLIENDAEGIGLFRTEFLFMENSQLPSEDQQFECYKEVLSRMDNKPVIIRTLDIGGDKSLPYMELPKEENLFSRFKSHQIVS